MCPLICSEKALMTLCVQVCDKTFPDPRGWTFQSFLYSKPIADRSRTSIIWTFCLMVKYVKIEVIDNLESDHLQMAVIRCIEDILMELRWFRPLQLASTVGESSRLYSGATTKEQNTGLNFDEQWTQAWQETKQRRQQSGAGFPWQITDTDNLQRNSITEGNYHKWLHVPVW